MTGVLLAASKNIDVGTHITVKVAGISLYLDTIYTTLIAGAIVIAIGLLIRHQVTSGVPGRAQIAYESVLGAIQRQVEATIGPRTRTIVPLAFALFFVILAANWLEIIPSGKSPEYLPAPTSDVNLTYALGILVVILAHVYGMKARGSRRYIGHFFEGYKALIPITLIEEIVKPFTLALRLFGNLFAGGLMILLIATLFPPTILWAPTILWKLFDMFIGAIQAFIFALLTVIYFEFAMTGD
ncbi:MAG: ATP synthase F0 subunit A [Acidimicrobiales bacterium]|nr:MAG: ATP synthase F0 subunit A [Acidimicrobiales bacterium]